MRFFVRVFELQSHGSQLWISRVPHIKTALRFQEIFYSRNLCIALKYSPPKSKLSAACIHLHYLNVVLDQDIHCRTKAQCCKSRVQRSREKEDGCGWRCSDCGSWICRPHHCLGTSQVPSPTTTFPTFSLYCMPLYYRAYKKEQRRAEPVKREMEKKKKTIRVAF